MLVAIALAYGVSDAGNNTALSTIIGRMFAEKSEVRVVAKHLKTYL